MGDVLFPFPGRVENSKYSFGGKEHELKNVRIKDGHAIHGFAKLIDWQVVEQSENQVASSCSLEKSDYEKNGYPFSLKLAVTYSLNENGLTVESKVENSGKEPAPFGLGFHPYFTVGGENIDSMNLTIKARKLVEFDEELKPTGRLIDVSEGELDFNAGKIIGNRIIDNCYTSLSYENGINQATISYGEDRKFIIWQDESFPYLQVYSADTIGDEHRRKGFAIEPQTCTGFAFNRPEMGLKIIKAGEVFVGKWGIKY
jgi:aldose 1-epimerase